MQKFKRRDFIKTISAAVAVPAILRSTAFGRERYARHISPRPASCPAGYSNVRIDAFGDDDA